MYEPNTNPASADDVDAVPFAICQAAHDSFIRVKSIDGQVCSTCPVVDQQDRKTTLQLQRDEVTWLV